MPGAASRFAGARLLFVEDDDVARESLVMLLSHESFVVTAARNGADALRLFARDAFDLVVSDVEIPGLDGLTLMSEIRARSATPVVLMSAHASDEIFARSTCAPAAFLHKPFTLDALLATVLGALARAALG